MLTRTVAEVLKTDFKNNKSAMSRAYGCTRQNIDNWLSGDFHVTTEYMIIKIHAVRLDGHYLANVEVPNSSNL